MNRSQNLLNEADPFTERQKVENACDALKKAVSVVSIGDPDSDYKSDNKIAKALIKMTKQLESMTKTAKAMDHYGD